MTCIRWTSMRSDFNSHAPCGARLQPKKQNMQNVYFNSHAPCGARQYTCAVMCWPVKFQLTRPMRGATAPDERARPAAMISTHTPHAGRDADPARWYGWKANFNSHAPCGARPEGLIYSEFADNISTHTPHAGRDRLYRGGSDKQIAFQLTRPMRGATLVRAECDTGQYHFNSHAPCGARLPCAGRTRRTLRFQLTRPMRGATPD